MKKVLFIAFTLLFTSTALAETIKFRNGQILDGSVVDRPDLYIKISPGEIIWKELPKDPKEKKKAEYEFQEIPINEGVSIPAYQYRWDVTEIKFEFDPIALETKETAGEKKIFHPDGRLKMVCDSKGDVLDGTCRTFSQEGSPVLIVRYTNGQLDSLEKVFYANGNIYYEASKPGSVREYYDDGQVKVEKTDQYAKLFWKDGKVHREVNYQQVAKGKIRGDYHDYDRQENVLMRYSRITHGYDQHLEEGQRYEKKADWSNAIRSYEQAYQINPDSAEINMALGTVYFKSGNAASAMAFFEKATLVAPNHITARMAAGIASRTNKEYDRAIEYFEKAQELDRNYYLPSLEIGRTYYSWGKLSDAQKYFKKALDIKPQALEAYEGLKLAEMQLKNK